MDQYIENFSEKHGRASSFASKSRQNGKLHIIQKGVKRYCVVCSNREHEGKRHITLYCCDICSNKPRMIIGGCFHRYPNRQHYKQEILILLYYSVTEM